MKEVTSLSRRLFFIIRSSGVTLGLGRESHRAVEQGGRRGMRSCSQSVEVASAPAPATTKRLKMPPWRIRPLGALHGAGSLNLLLLLIRRTKAQVLVSTLADH